MRDKIKGVAAGVAAIAVLAVGGAAIAGATGGGSDQQSEPPEASEPAGQSDADENESATENESADENDSAGENEGAGDEGQAEANDGPDQPISADALKKASAAALAETGGGKVTDSERGDEQSYYEVEVTRADGSQVDVHLDRGFNVVSSEADSGD